MFGPRFFILDTETSGLSKEDCPCEIAWIEVDGNLDEVDRKHSLIDPERPISPGASGVHGIRDRDVVHEPTLYEFIVELCGNPFATTDTVIIAHNAPFDTPFVAPYVKSLAGTLCTLKAARLIYPDAENHKLQTLRFALELEIEGDAHSAMGDVLVTRELLKRILSDTGMSLADLYHYVNKPRLIEVMTFGKHKGFPLRKLPRQYVQWLLTLDNLDSDLRYSLGLL
jgi:exodeoxyribonuclease X